MKDKKIIIDPIIKNHMKKYRQVLMGLLALDMIPYLGETFAGPKNWFEMTPPYQNDYMLKRLVRRNKKEFLHMKEIVENLIEKNIIYYNQPTNQFLPNWEVIH